MTKITAPVAQDGIVETMFGAHAVRFEDGVADVDFEINDGLKSYLLSNGYGLGSTKAVEPDAAPEPPDPREVGHVDVSTKLRDAAVDPHEDDFLPPTNAGDANPHGFDVVAPGIHASGPGPIVPGTVGTPEYQQAKETATAQAVLSDGELAPDVMDKLRTVADAEYMVTNKDGTAKGLDELTDDERDLLGLGTEPGTDPDLDELDAEASSANLDQPTLDSESATPVEDLKGDALTEALKEAELPVSGTAAEKRQRLQEYRDAQLAAQTPADSEGA